MKGFDWLGGVEKKKDTNDDAIYTRVGRWRYRSYYWEKGENKRGLYIQTHII